MTKEELEKEAEEKCVCTDEAMRIMYGIGYIDGAEPREKRIAELEMTVGTLRTFSNEQATCIERLKKENAKLEMTVGTLRTFSNEQATCIERLKKENAKLERIVEMVAMINKGVYTDEGIKAIYAEAEQFLSEVEK